ncbi:hypothetical protein Xmir_03873 [Xenorhabdus miraniensis]|uniref:Uncharacterized protein n=1 Tax=Xenorhabdus miraniensis TaxID=351674 RepID=A0A2D0JKQ1_9GAMM|nr:hypothetical protein Xmir_04037 [Xenorhabdus miraniensis]PHM46824.1 hypothetical protein Xmir_03873 [Xenorhabdus miraniensis]
MLISMDSNIQHDDKGKKSLEAGLSYPNKHPSVIHIGRNPFPLTKRRNSLQRKTLN